MKETLQREPAMQRIIPRSSLFVRPLFLDVMTGEPEGELVRQRAIACNGRERQG